ncbi:GNAT family N-acetyltransferase [Vagococcus sp. DIV0080]|uniref:GNAT family N-acetyltransferase n=1 Tax=Candidatus Vagococcus giribetii TaxID=2230876 RepID=A0ABS3HQL4_9ENTE|nr:GNAT family N-acetyltransferase [Vagococcus sp. DIV0080]MBO0475625.1 GNAT family N-acetyltransferase [Vagococcus sp. DIV0080]
MTYRKAEINDTELIYQFIMELAEYEGLANEVTTTIDTLKESLFERNSAEVIIVEEDNKNIGFCLYFYNFSTFLGKPGLYIEDLYIRKEYRGEGHGKKLLEHMVKLAKQENLGRVEWWCLDENKPSIDFYKSQGAQMMDEWTVFRISVN